MYSWYFAYGSNLWIDQMIERTGFAGHPEHPPRVARLANYQLAFQSWEKDGCAYANIITPGDGVLGVIYYCSESDLKKLDDFEFGYDRQAVVVKDSQGEDVAAIAYIVRRQLPVITGNPSKEYLKKIITGATQHALPEDYISEIMSIANL